ncbi:MAG: hypothetical protein H0V17_28620 [Deltaproteobacteria bacterium]|nr:hypothetical protein [Deltaproteobacteria bacterium]
MGVLVLGMGVYLFFEVRSRPAAPQARTAAKAAEPEAEDKEDKEVGEAKAQPAGDRPYTPGIRGMARKVENEKVGDPARGDAGSAPALGSEDPPADGKLEGPKLEAVMAEANRAYDKMEFDDARSIAQKVLKQHPTNTRMLRVMASAHCIESDTAEAQKYFNLLPPPDREQMKTRCARYGVTFTDPPAK